MRLVTLVMVKRIYHTDPVKGKLFVGTLIERKGYLIFRKKVVRDKHYMKIVKGYGIQKDVFDKYLRGKKGRIEIIERGGKYLVASIKEWTNHSKYGNYGDGRQVFLSERYMHNSDNFSRETTEEITYDTYLKTMSELAKIFRKRYPKSPVS